MFATTSPQAVASSSTGSEFGAAAGSAWGGTAEGGADTKGSEGGQKT